MITEELQKIIREMPAGHFVVHVAERTPIEIPHPDYAMLSPGGDVLIVYDVKRDLHYINTNSITRVVLNATADQK